QVRTAGECRLHGLQQAEQQERDDDGGERQRRAHSLALQVGPEQGKVFHASAVTPSCPLFRCRVCLARAAACGSCVTMMMVLPCFSLSACSRSRISSPALRSRSPVGSSHNSSVGSDTMARAMPTRCSCPPESSRGLCFARSLKPTRLSAAAARLCRSEA